MFLSILLILSIVSMIFILYLLHRNYTVYHYRQYIQELVFDERPGEPANAYVKRLKYYDSVSYDDMMRKFWKPVNSFYDERKFK